MSSRLRLIPTELADRLVRPPPNSEAVGSPEPVLNGKPGEEGALWGGPGVPDDGHERAGGSSQKLSLVGGLGRVDSRRG